MFPSTGQPFARRIDFSPAVMMAQVACQWNSKQASFTWQDTEDCFELHHVLLVGAFCNCLRPQVFSDGDAARQPKGALCLVPANRRNFLSAIVGIYADGANNDVYCAAAVEPAIYILPLSPLPVQVAVTLNQLILIALYCERSISCILNASLMQSGGK